LQLAKEDRIKMVLPGIDVPDLNGTIAAATHRVHPSINDVSAIAFTAHDIASTPRTGTAFERDGCTPKPFDTHQIPGQITACQIH
jgi:hypothetical protein